MIRNAARHHMMKRTRRAFTLLELVIVLGIILLLMGLVLGVGSVAVTVGKFWETIGDMFGTF